MASTSKRRRLDIVSEEDPTSGPGMPVTLSSLGLANVLPERLAEQSNAPCFPHRPAQLPADPPEDLLVDALQQLNEHPRDKHITFEAKDHTYFWDGKRVTRSVTQLVHGFANEFSEDRIIDSMRTSTNWPRPGYLKPTLSEYQKNRIAATPRDRATPD